jgi:hypothetical protein
LAPNTRVISSAAELDVLQENGLRFEKLEDGKLTLTASFDFTQYTKYRLICHEVHYVALPMGFRMTGGSFELIEAPAEFAQWYGMGPLKGLRIRVEGFEFTVYCGRLELEELF